MPGNDKTRKLVMPSISKHKKLHAESSEDTGLEPLLEEIRQKHGSALLAILVYGSWLRGKRDTMHLIPAGKDGCADCYRQTFTTSTIKQMILTNKTMN